MKRNLDLIRHILLVTESSDTGYLSANTYVTDEYSYLKIYYHISLLMDNEFLIVNEVAPVCGLRPEYVVVRLTSKGHDFLESVRDDNIFNKTKNKIASIAGTTTLEIVKDIAINLIKTQLGI